MSPRFPQDASLISNSAGKYMGFGGLMNHNQSIITTGMDETYEPHQTNYNLSEKKSRMKFLRE
jgi:hypothetical protein